jgi:hypothetical protein
MLQQQKGHVQVDVFFFCLQTRRHENIPTLWHMCATYSQYELRNWEDGKEEIE